jgi:hypothetical protein
MAIHADGFPIDRATVGANLLAGIEDEVAGGTLTHLTSLLPARIGIRRPAIQGNRLRHLQAKSADIANPTAPRTTITCPTACAIAAGPSRGFIRAQVPLIPMKSRHRTLEQIAHPNIGAMGSPSREWRPQQGQNLFFGARSAPHSGHMDVP